MTMISGKYTWLNLILLNTGANIGLILKFGTSSALTLQSAVQTQGKVRGFRVQWAHPTYPGWERGNQPGGQVGSTAALCSKFPSSIPIK
jgi:hypothetical protein